MEGLRINKAIKKSLRDLGVKQFIEQKVLNFVEDGQGVILKILPLLLKIPVDLYVMQNEKQVDPLSDEHEQAAFLKYIPNAAEFPDVKISTKVSTNQMYVHSKDINFHQAKPLNLLMLDGKF